MEFSIVAEFGIIEEACNATKHPAACFPVVEFSVNQQFAFVFVQIPKSIR